MQTLGKWNYITEALKSKPWAILPNKIQNIFCKEDIRQHGIVTFLSSIEILQTLTRKSYKKMYIHTTFYTRTKPKKGSPGPRSPSVHILYA